MSKIFSSTRVSVLRPSTQKQIDDGAEYNRNQTHCTFAPTELNQK